MGALAKRKKRDNCTTATSSSFWYFAIARWTHTHTVPRTMSRWSAVALIARRSNVEGLPGIPREGAVSTPLKGEAGRSKKYTNRNHDPLRSNERGYSSSSNSHWHFALGLATSTRSGSFKKAHALNALGHRPSTKRDGRRGLERTKGAWCMVFATGVASMSRGGCSCVSCFSSFGEALRPPQHRKRFPFDDIYTLPPSVGCTRNALVVD